MQMRKPMTPTEKRLFKEAVIREYQLKHEVKQKKNSAWLGFRTNLRKVAPINIIVGLVAAALGVIFYSWSYLFQTLITSIIWITLVSTIVSALLKPK